MQLGTFTKVKKSINLRDIASGLHLADRSSRKIKID